MNEQSAQAIVTIASIAAMADGEHNAEEREQVAAVASRLGVTLDTVVINDAAEAPIAAAQVARRLDDDDAREAAYRVASAVCSADGYVNTRETMFLHSLARSLDIDAAAMEADMATAAQAVDAWLHTEQASASGTARGTGGANAESLEEFILDQAMLTAALELLPDKIANLGIVPLQLRLVHTIGERSGAAGNGTQVRELMATLGIGIAAQVMETVVRRTLGGLGRGLLGGLFGGAAGVAAGGAVTFASTYALGHAARQYYAQDRTLSSAGLKALYNKMRADGTEMYPRVQERITRLARGNSFQSIMDSVRGSVI